MIKVIMITSETFQDQSEINKPENAMKQQEEHTNSKVYQWHKQRTESTLPFAKIYK